MFVIRKVMNRIKAIKSFLQEIKIPLSFEEREKKAIALAALLLESGLRDQTFQEKQAQKILAKMLKDPNGKDFALCMTDQCFRSQNTKRTADQIIFLLTKLGIPHYLPWFHRASLFLFTLFGKSQHFWLVPFARWALIKTTSRVVIPEENPTLIRHIQTRRVQGIRLNLNHLGEAVLGETEAIRRLNTYLQDLESDAIAHISVKVSTLFSQINILDWDQTMEILANRLRRLYRMAKYHTYRNADGRSLPKSVHLDMEEYCDLHLSKELFKKVLSEEEFLSFSAGIALQAYLPDSFRIQQELTSWARQRMNERGGAPIHIRIVKGANLAMEQVESSFQNWKFAPYKTKTETDANYKRMLLYGCQKEHTAAVHIGVATHNLFDIAYALLLRKEAGLENEISFEMLEGMANHFCRVVQKITGNVLLYCPVAKQQDFQNAIAYLMRRFDENTGPENFLTHCFYLQPNALIWHKQAEQFSLSCKKIKTVNTEPHRTQNRFDPPPPISLESPFENEPNTDLSLPPNHRWAHRLLAEWRGKKFQKIPLVVGGKEMYESPTANGVDPSQPNQIPYQYSQAEQHHVNIALSTAKAKEKAWSETAIKERARLLSIVAQKMREQRNSLIGAMMKDGGKIFIESDAEVSEAIDFVQYYARNILTLTAMAEYSFTAKGTILIAPPWNFPISIPTGGIAASLITGNCVLFKPAPEAVLCGWVVANIFWEAGISREVLQFIPCVDTPIGSQMLQDSRINAIILTGATATARHFMHVRPSLDLAAETGGKNAIIITAMADRDLAIKHLVKSAFGHSGQKCSAASLAILEAEVYDDIHFMEQLKDAVESLPIGTCWDLSAKIIPLIRPPNPTLLRGLTTLEAEEKWLVQPHPNSLNSHLWSPGIKLGISQGSFMHQTELFGPLLGVMRAESLEEAISFANGTPYGLTAGLQSLDDREIALWLDRIESGNCYVNREITGAIVQRQPFGGCKSSSFGLGCKTGGPNYISQFLHKIEHALPVAEEYPPIKSIEALSSLAEIFGKQEIWLASIASYLFWKEKFSKAEDPSPLLGEDNMLCYRPRNKMALRIEKCDSPIDALRSLAAAHICGSLLFISCDPDFPFSLPQFTLENLSTFSSRLAAFTRVRLLSSPSEQLQQAAAVAGCYLDAEPVLSNGRFELLHYLREVTISITYHRYGNLGLKRTFC